MNIRTISVMTPLAATIAAVVLTAAQFSGIDSLAAPRDAGMPSAAVVQLPRVVVNASRDDAVATAHLPTVVVTASRADAIAAVRLPTVVVTGQALRDTAALAATGAAI